MIGGVVVVALALWKLKVLIALLFLAFIISAAMRPSVDAWLARRKVPRAAAILLHYAALIGLLVALLTAVVPRALDQVQNALGDLPSTRAELRQQARDSEGIKHRVLLGIEDRLERLPSPRTSSRRAPRSRSSPSRSSSASSSCSRAPRTGSTSENARSVS